MGRLRRRWRRLSQGLGDELRILRIRPKRLPSYWFRVRPHRLVGKVNWTFSPARSRSKLLWRAGRQWCVISFGHCSRLILFGFRRRGVVACTRYRAARNYIFLQQPPLLRGVRNMILLSSLPAILCAGFALRSNAWYGW